MEDIKFIFAIIYFSVAVLLYIVEYISKDTNGDKDYGYIFLFLMAFTPIINIVILAISIANIEIDEVKIEKLKNTIYFLPLLVLIGLYWII